MKTAPIFYFLFLFFPFKYIPSKFAFCSPGDQRILARILFFWGVSVHQRELAEEGVLPAIGRHLTISGGRVHHGGVRGQADGGLRGEHGAGPVGVPHPGVAPDPKRNGIKGRPRQ